ncbi:hypothetical protein KIN20_018136 [Parelaphostrongylus tenuis]|uniref:Uncharacterized protein n=1 Tax=Parelaphostrongylus tenuis TaxID=148309 RepID=A0AAD5MIV3_PARTN|nr:hypothetical protein KIN20_018136 [Parelaphostrongylus tenuis]
MFRRLGERNYRAESPMYNNFAGSNSLSTPSDTTLPSDSTTVSHSNSSEFDSCPAVVETPKECSKENRVLDKSKIAVIEAAICNKLSTIVDLVHEFSTDALDMRESADDLLDELQTNIRPYLISLDVEMCSAEAVLRYNIDRSNINESRVDWLLMYTKYQKEMRRVFSELAGTVYDDLEDSLELRKRGCISRRPCSKTINNLQEMKRGMQRAVELLCGGPRSVA